MSVDGLFTCWDIEQEQDNPAGGSGKRIVGKQMASLQTAVRPTMWNFHADGPEVLIALFGTDRR